MGIYTNLPWLLEPDNPSVRYLALTELMNQSRGNPEVIAAKQAVMEIGAVPRILDKMNSDHWGVAEDFYIRSKFKGTVWNLIILAGLEADGKDERIKRACEFILERSQDPDPYRGGFAYQSGVQGGGDHNKVLPCLTGNMVWCLLRFGYMGDPRVQRGIDWITTYQRFDDGGGEAPGGWPYDRFEKCYGSHTCHMGVVKSLKALAEIPTDRRTAAVRTTISTAAEYLLKHHIYKRSHDLSAVAKERWLLFGFPLMWDMDVLEVLLLLSRLGYCDKRMDEALGLVLSKHDDQGRWAMERSFNGRFLVNIERKGKPSKWVTLNALRVLQRTSAKAS